jgi:hypothetical protein
MSTRGLGLVMILALVGLDRHCLIDVTEPSTLALLGSGSATSSGSS